MGNKKISNKKYNGGYVGLLALLITVAIIAYLIVQSDLFKNFGTENTDTVKGSFDAIDSARNAKNLIEQHSREAAGQ